MRKILLTIISIYMVILVGASVCYADDKIYCSPDSSENLSVLCQYKQDEVEIKYDSAAEKNSYFIPNSSTLNSDGYTKYGRILNFYIDDSVFFDNSEFEKIELEIEYKDAGFEHFYVTYDSHDGEKIYQDYIELYDTNQTQKTVITLDDARFSNKCSNGMNSSGKINANADFSITVPRRKDGTGVYIYSVTVKRTGIYGGVKILSASSASGNIFFDGMNKKFDISFENKRSNNANMNVRYSILDSKENICLKKDKTISVDSGKVVYDTVSLSDITKYGIYTLRVEAEQEGMYVIKDIPFSLCADASAGRKNMMMGLGTHFSWGRESKPGFEIIKKAGISNIREGYGWAGFETEKGVYNEPEAYTEYLANAHEGGFNILTAATYGNTLYGMTTSQYMPETDEQRRAYVNYILEMLRLNHEKIDVIEVWNEPDSSNYNPNAYDKPETYLKLLQAVSKAVRQEYQDVKIAGPAMSSATLTQKMTWLESLLSASVTDDDGKQHFASEYFDIVTIHHYALNYDHSIKATMETLAEIKSLFAKYGCGDKEIYHTEFGASHLERNGNDVEKNDLHFQAEKLARYYLGLCSSNTGNRYYIYDFSDDTLANNVLGSNLGIVGSHMAEVPYYGKPALLAVAHINKLIGAKEVTEYNTFELEDCEHLGKNKHYGYEIRFGNILDDSIVTALFTDKEDIPYTFHSDGKFTEFFDLYGNRIDNIQANNGEYTLSIGKSPVFAKVRQSETEIHAYEGDNCVILSGCLGEVSQSVTVKVVNQKNETVFIGETETNNNGRFEFRFEVPDKNSTYTALIGSQILGGIYRFSFDASSLEKALVSVYLGTDKVVSAKEFCLGVPLEVSAEFFGSETTSFDMIIGYYQGDVLLDVKLIHSSEMTKDENRYTARIEDSVYPNAEKVSVFVFDSIEHMRPLEKTLILN